MHKKTVMRTKTITKGKTRVASIDMLPLSPLKDRRIISPAECSKVSFYSIKQISCPGFDPSLEHDCNSDQYRQYLKYLTYFQAFFIVPKIKPKLCHNISP